MISLKEVIKICELIFPDYEVASGNVSCTVYNREGTVVEFIELIDSQIQGRLFLLTGFYEEVSQRLREVFTITCRDATSNYSVCFYITGVK